MLGRTPRDVMLASKELSSLLESRDFWLSDQMPHKHKLLKVNSSLNGI